jgi:hypothetical protein
MQGRTYEWIVTGAAWYASGDAERNPRTATNGPLKANSGRLPVPVAEKSWGNPPLIGEWVLSTSWFGAPDLNQSRFRNLSGTSGTGMSVQRRSKLGAGYLHWGAGLGLVAATGASDVISDPKKAGEKAGGWGRWVVESDIGFVYRFYNNPNFSFRGLAGYMVPERNDRAWATGFVTQFDF